MTSSRPGTLSILIGTLVAVAVALPAAAETVKKKRAAKKQAVVATDTNSGRASAHRGTNLFPAGPLYHSGVYLGDDPDPFIRLQLQRDLSGRLGGDQ